MTPEAADHLVGGPIEPTDALVDRLAATVRSSAPRLGEVRLVCVDGPAGSGKTTLANRLAGALRAQVLHVDDLLDGWGGLAGMLPRLRDGVLEPLAAGRPGRYRRYDWIAQDFAEWHDVPVQPVLVIEGCGSARRGVDEVAVLRVWVEASDDVRLARWVARGGEADRVHWSDWARDEGALFAADGTRSRADEIVDTSGWGRW